TTSSFGYIFGRHPNSLAGRDNPDFMITGQGVGPDGQSPNTASARTDDYYGRLGNVTEINVYDASYIKLRQLSLSYQLGPRLLAKMPFLQGATLSLVGRNLFFFSNGLDELGLDPEAIYTATGNDIGIEYSALPSTRTFGFNLNLKF
ncbi:MAG: SusC/RagA family TonB-linked outer membrane protein, partial [Bacteroidota bacterium]